MSHAKVSLQQVYPILPRRTSRKPIYPEVSFTRKGFMLVLILPGRSDAVGANVSAFVFVCMRAVRSVRGVCTFPRGNPPSRSPFCLPLPLSLFSSLHPCVSHPHAPPALSLLSSTSPGLSAPATLIPNASRVFLPSLCPSSSELWDARSGNWVSRCRSQPFDLHASWLPDGEHFVAGFDIEET